MSPDELALLSVVPPATREERLKRAAERAEAMRSRGGRAIDLPPFPENPGQYFIPPDPEGE